METANRSAELVISDRNFSNGVRMGCTAKGVNFKHSNSVISIVSTAKRSIILRVCVCVSFFSIWIDFTRTRFARFFPFISPYCRTLSARFHWISFKWQLIKTHSNEKFGACNQFVLLLAVATSLLLLILITKCDSMVVVRLCVRWSAINYVRFNQIKSYFMWPRYIFSRTTISPNWFSFNRSQIKCERVRCSSDGRKMKEERKIDRTNAIHWV